MSEQLDVLKDVASRLERAEIPYMISGSIAMNYYAQPRMTRDIDLVVDLTLEDAPRFEEVFATDYYLDVDNVRTAIANRSMFNLIHLAYVVKVDFIVRKENEYRRLEFSRRRRVEVEAVTLYIVSPEDLVLSKLDWARDTRSEIQLRDIRNLISSVSTLDCDYLKTWAEVLGLASLLREVKG